MNKKEALSLVKSRFEPEDYSLIHGTGTRAIIKLFEKDYLPSSFFKPHEVPKFINDHPSHNGHLYFVPIKNQFKNHPLHDKIFVEQEDSLNFIEGYGHIGQERDFLAETFENWPDRISCDDIEDYFRGIYPSVPAIISDNGVDIEFLHAYGFTNILNYANELKGVYLGLNKKALELDIKDGSDEEGLEVMIHLPRGLSKEYISGIYPAGIIEKQKIFSYINKMK